MKQITATDRLWIQEAEVADTKFILDLLNSPSWIAHIGDRGVKTEKQAQGYIKNSLTASYKKHGFGLFKMILKTEDTPIGLCGFLQRDYLNHPDIGFAILPEFEGNGYTYEACMALMEHARHKLGLERINGITTPSNIKSCNLLKKIGLKPNGTVSPPGKEIEYLLFTA